MLSRIMRINRIHSRYFPFVYKVDIDVHTMGSASINFDELESKLMPDIKDCLYQHQREMETRGNLGQTNLIPIYIYVRENNVKMQRIAVSPSYGGDISEDSINIALKEIGEMKNEKKPKQKLTTLLLN